MTLGQQQQQPPQVLNECQRKRQRREWHNPIEMMQALCTTPLAEEALSIMRTILEETNVAKDEDVEKRKKYFEASGGGTVAVVVDAVINAMRRHLAHADVQETGCRTLGRILTQVGEESGSAIGSMVVAIVLAAMQRHEDDARVQQSACELLATLYHRLHQLDDASSTMLIPNDNDNTQNVLFGAVVRAMRQHADHVGVQTVACSALWNMSVTEDNERAITACGGTEAILEAMHRHTRVASVQENATGALLNMIYLDQHKVSVGTRGIEATMNVMEQHLENGSIQQEGCGLLLTLAAIPANGSRIAAEGGMRVLATAMEEHLDRPQLQEYGIVALARVAVHCDLNEHYNPLEFENAVERILKAMERHKGPNHERIRHVGCAAVCQLYQVAQEYDEETARNALQHVLDGMRRYPDDVFVQERGCALLFKFAAQTAGNAAASVFCSAIVKGGGIQVIIAAMQRHSSEAAVQHNGCGALARLAAATAAGENDKEDVSIAISAMGGIHVILEAMATHTKDSEVQYRACQSLVALARRNTFHRFYIRSLLGDRLVETALQEHCRSHAGVVEHGMELQEILWRGCHLRHEQRLGVTGDHEDEDDNDEDAEGDDNVTL